MKILFLSQVLPFPLDAGPKIRSFYVLKYLAERHDITLLSFSRPGDDEYLPFLRQYCRNIITVPIRRSRYLDFWYLTKSVILKQPFLVIRDDNSEMRRAIRELNSLEHFEAVHTDQLNMAQYAASLTGILKVLDEHNAVFTIIDRLGRNEQFWPKKKLLQLEARKLLAYETNLLHRFDQVVCVTLQDKSALELAANPRDIKPTRQITVIPICIDPEAIKPSIRNPVAKKAICIGSMFYPPNVEGVVWFIDKVMPIIVREEPSFRFIVVGPRPAPAIIGRARKNPNLLITGYVSDPQPYMNESAAFLVPLLSGGGMRVKILDGWARGMPIVSTSIGCEGLKVTPNRNIEIADTPEDFAEAVVGIFRNPGHAKELSENGTAWVRANYDWHTQYSAFDAIYGLN